MATQRPPSVLSGFNNATKTGGCLCHWLTALFRTHRLEKAGHGGSVAAPIAKKIYEYYFTAKQKKENPEPSPSPSLEPSPEAIAIKSPSPQVTQPITSKKEEKSKKEHKPSVKEEEPKEKKKRKFPFFKKMKD